MMKSTIIACFLILALSLTAQQQLTITGYVTEATTGDSGIGVTVLVKGTSNGTVTDIDGNYTLNNVPSNGTLIFSYIGMTTVEEPVNGRSTVNVTLSEDVQALDEVVVIGYGTARKRDLTGSIASIDADEIANRPSSNLLASIQGKVAGVQVVNTGRAGQDPEVRIRGTNSINGYSPLYVVDGLFSENINYLNPADIESMEILKDPSSLAIFGVRGANGVIIVNTKRARKGETVVNFNSSIGYKEVVHRMNMTNATQFRELYDEQRINQGLGSFDYSDWNADTDWQDAILQRGIMTNNNISITGSGEKSRFYLGVGYTSEEGSIINEKYSRLTLNLSSDYNVSDALRFGYQVNASRTKPSDAKGVNGAIRAAPIAPIYDESGTLLHTLPDFQRAQVWNPLVDVETRANHNIGINHRAAGNIYGELDFLNNFSFKTTLSLDYAVGENRSYSPIITVFNPDVGGAEDLTTTESVTQSKSTRTVAQGDYILSYNNNFGAHSLSATAGLTTNFTEYSSIGASRSQNIEDIIFSIPSNDIDKWWISSISDKSTSNSSDQYKRFTMSYLLRALYNYENRYLFNASYRRDGASVFRSVGNTWDNFYSFGAGWVASEESFMKDVDAVDYLKLKGSWGVLGSQNTGGFNYPTYPRLQSSGSAFGDCGTDCFWCDCVGCA